MSETTYEAKAKKVGKGQWQADFPDGYWVFVESGCASLHDPDGTWLREEFDDEGRNKGPWEFWYEGRHYLAIV